VQTLPAVQASLRTVRNEFGQPQDRVETLEARLEQHSTTVSQPPSSDSPYPAWAACGGWALVEAPRWCQRTKAPPIGDAWWLWYARLSKLIDRYRDRAHEAG